MKSVFGKYIGAVLGVMFSLSAANAGATGKKVAYFDSGPTHPYVAAQNKAVNARAKELGLELTQFDTPYDAALQSQQMDDAIARKFDLLAVMAASQGAIVPALNRAKKAGVPVIIMNNGVKEGVEDLYVSEIEDDNAKLGRLAAESAVRALKEGGREQGKIALITGVLAEGVAKTRLEAFNAVMKDHPEIKVVATEDAYWDTAKSEVMAGQLFARFAPQGGLDIVVGWADNQSAAIIRAAEAVHLPFGTAKGQLTVIGMNCTPETVQMIKSGKEYSTGTQSPVKMATKSMDVVADYFNGKTPPKRVILDVQTITKDNIDQWAADCTY